MKRTTFRDRQQLVETGREPAPEAGASQRTSRDPGRPPAGYGDQLLWSMAGEFERLAYKHRVGLGGRGVPYIYKALAETADRSGIRDIECRDGNAKVVRGAELGVRLVRFFWDRAPWDGSGDVIAQFSDPIMFEDCLAKMREIWQLRRVHQQIEERRRNAPPDEPMPPSRRTKREGN